MTYQDFSDDLSTGCLTLDHQGSFCNSARGLTEHFSVYIYPNGMHVWVSTVDGTTTVKSPTTTDDVCRCPFVGIRKRVSRVGQ